MEASTYAWAVILTFFVLYGTIQLRKCFLQLLSSGEQNSAPDRLSSNSVYTIENDSAVRSFRTDQDILRSVNGSSKNKDDLPSYEDVIASDKLKPINNLPSSLEVRSNANESVGTSSSNVIASNPINRSITLKIKSDLK